MIEKKTSVEKRLSLDDPVIPINQVVKRTQKTDGAMQYGSDNCDNCQCGGCYGCQG